MAPPSIMTIDILGGTCFLFLLNAELPPHSRGPTQILSVSQLTAHEVQKAEVEHIVQGNESPH